MGIRLAVGRIILGSALLSLLIGRALSAQHPPPPPPAVGSIAVTPDGGTEPARESNTGGYITIFWVKNKYSTQQTVHLVCSGKNNVTCAGTDPTQMTLAAGDSATTETTYNVGAANNKGVLYVTSTSPYVDSGYYNVVIANPTPPTVALTNHNGDNRDRSLCLTAGAGEGAAWQCGDLLVSHSLPGYATMGRERALTLLYNSAVAVPQPIVAASVTEGSLGPGAVFVRLSINGVPRDSATFTGWSNASRQIVIAHNARADSSGIYPFTLLVRNIFSGSVQDATISDTLMTVNRANALYGSGWSLAGVEELRLNQPGGRILWIGGDGSSKIYRSVATNTWQSAAGAYRDTLIQFDSASTTWWRRTMRHGISVTYRVTGSGNVAKHVRTTNRVGQSTIFTWNGDTLKKLAVPPDTSASTAYNLAYVSGRLDRITDPAGRVLDATVTGNRMTRIVDPDTTIYHTDFVYDSIGRMTSRTTRRGYTTSYGYASGLRVTSLTIPVGRVTGDTANARTTFSPWDEKGFATGLTGQSAVDVALVYTKIDGPRLAPAADTASFWVDRWGAPTQMRDAVGSVITIQRADASVPAQTTQVQYQNGRIVRLMWNSRGNLMQSRDSTWHLADSVRLQTAVKRWTYPSDPVKQDSPDSTIDSTSTGKIFTRYSYNSIGTTDSVVAPNGHVTRFFTRTTSTDPLRGLVDSVIELQVPAWDTTSKSEPPTTLRTKFLYNGLGNLLRTTSPSGRVDSLVRDGAQRVSNRYDPAGHRVETVYDALNRVVQSKQHVEGLDSGFSSPLLTQTHYLIDLVDQVTDPRGVPRTFGYDFGGRQVVEVDDYGMRDSTFFDRAGLVDSLRPRFLEDSTGKAVRFTYDNLGRVTKKTWPARDSVPADSISYTYDVMGNVLTATSANWMLTRTYYANGSLRSEIQAHPDGSNRFTMFYAYDRMGRRAWYRSGTPGNVAERDSIWYSYDPPSGELRAVSVRWRGSQAPTDSVRFRWDALGRRDSVIYRNGLKVWFAYDADGALRLVCGSHSGGPDPFDAFDFTEYHRTINVEGLDLFTSHLNEQIGGCGANADLNDTRSMTYDSRHQVLYQLIGPDAMTYRYDASGNVSVKQVNGINNWRYFTDSLHNRLRAFYDAANMPLGDTTHIWYKGDGGRLVEQPFLNGVGNDGQGSGFRYYWYDALGRTTGTGEWQCIPGTGDESGPGDAVLPISGPVEIVELRYQDRGPLPPS